MLHRTLNVSATVDEVAKQLICSTAAWAPVSFEGANVPIVLGMFGLASSLGSQRSLAQVGQRSALDIKLTW